MKEKNILPLLGANPVDISGNPMVSTKMKYNVPIVDISLVNKLGDVTHVEFKVYNCFKRDYDLICIPYSDVSVSRIRRILLDHASLPANAEFVTEYIQSTIVNLLRSEQIIYKNVHTDIGFHKNDDGSIEFRQDKLFAKDLIVESEYQGQYDIKPRGCLKAFCRMIKSDVLATENWSPLEFIISVGISAQLIAFANLSWGIFMNNPINHLCGATTSGKTTSAMLAVSIGGNPNGAKGFFITFNSTPNAMIKRIGTNYGFPVAFDEFSSNSRKNVTDLIYTLANAHEADRLGSGGRNLQKAVEYVTTFISTGEISLLSKCNENQGILARCTEFNNVDWTESAEQSNRIKTECSENYGLVAPLVAEELLKNSNYWHKRFTRWQLRVRKRIEHDNIKLTIKERISDYVALYITSADLFNKVTGLHLHINKIFDFAYSHIIIANADNGNMGTRAYEAICNHYETNKEHYNDCWEDNFFMRKESVGIHTNAKRTRRIEGIGYDELLIYTEEQFNNLLAEKQFHAPKVVLKQLKDANLLKTKDSNRYTYPYVIGKTKINCVAVYIHDYSYDKVVENDCVNDPDAD